MVQKHLAIRFQWVYSGRSKRIILATPPCRKEMPRVKHALFICNLSLCLHSCTVRIESCSTINGMFVPWGHQAGLKLNIPTTENSESAGPTPMIFSCSCCYSWYGLPLYAYLIRRTGTFIFPYSNLATPLFSNGTPLIHIRYKHLCFYLRLAFIPIYMTPSLYLHTTRLYPLIRTSLVLCSISTRLYLPVEP